MYETFIKIALFAAAEILKTVRNEIGQPDALDFLERERAAWVEKVSRTMVH